MQFSDVLKHIPSIMLVFFFGIAIPMAILETKQKHNQRQSWDDYFASEKQRLRNEYIAPTINRLCKDDQKSAGCLFAHDMFVIAQTYVVLCDARVSGPLETRESAFRLAKRFIDEVYPVRLAENTVDELTLVIPPETCDADGEPIDQCSP